ncbi:unnamed protein product [Thelazia callipaeda]|uniref:Uncharacterized protein n=1 Tax=Thelazia callipaeda TaxID=103827 RepID=A0A0N5DAG1_THECL|nr:unnamed protein product [Thelazia callipaeda]
MSYRSTIFQLLSLNVLLVSFSNAQEEFFQPHVNQLPAPDLANNVLPEIFLGTVKKTDEMFDTSYGMPPDTLIDPDGRTVAYSKRREEQRMKEVEEERQLLQQISRKDGKKFVSWYIYCRTIFGCIGIVACGIIPAFILPSNSNEYLQSNAGRQSLNLLLSFAVGSLIGDVFLHLLPFVWIDKNVNKLEAGIWTMAGVLFCFLLEKLCVTNECSQRKMCAILNLMANFMDNFTHGLAIGGSFLLEPKLGWLTTFSIIIHELPHEISDFAILLRANFDRWSALLTAIGGALGACVALFSHTKYATNEASQNILPFTAGGFINIALAQILPELMKETNSRQNILQWICIMGGIIVMYAMNAFHLS